MPLRVNGLGPVLEESGGVGVAHGILGRNSSAEVRRIAGITETPAPVEESIIYSARIQDLSLYIFHVGALPDGGRRVVLFRTLVFYGFRRKGQESVDQDRGRAWRKRRIRGWNSSRQIATNVSTVALSGMIAPRT